MIIIAIMMVMFADGRGTLIMCEMRKKNNNFFSNDIELDGKKTRVSSDFYKISV